MIKNKIDASDLMRLKMTIKYGWCYFSIIILIIRVEYVKECSFTITKSTKVERSVVRIILKNLINCIKTPQNGTDGKMRNLDIKNEKKQNETKRKHVQTLRAQLYKSISSYICSFSNKIE